MARIDLKNKVIQAKIVYYGPGLCGKTTNLEYVSKHLAGAQELMSLSTEGDRTIFFDFMPLNLGKLRGMDVQFKLYTVPGQVRYNETRKMVLKNVDCVVFVADSQELMMDANQESLDNLYANLRELGIDADGTTIVLQYNKRDLPSALPVEALDHALNGRGYPTFLASAMRGDGVAETLKEACSLTLNRLVQTLPEAERPKAAATSATRATPAGAPAVAVSARSGNGSSPSKRSPPPQLPSAARKSPPAAPAKPGTARDDALLTEVQREPDTNAWLRASVVELAGTQVAMRHELAELRGLVMALHSERAALEGRLVERTQSELGPLGDKLDKIDVAVRSTGIERVEKSLEALTAGPLARMEGGLSELGRHLRQQHPTPGHSATREDFERLDARLWSEFARLRSELEERSPRPAAPSAEGLEARLAELPTKGDLESLSAGLKAIAEQVARFGKSIGDSSRLLEEHVRKVANGDEQLALARAKLEQLPTKADLDALRVELGSVAQSVAERVAAGPADVAGAPPEPPPANAEPPLAAVEAALSEPPAPRPRVTTERSWPPRRPREEPAAAGPSPAVGATESADAPQGVEAPTTKPPPRPSRRPTAMLPAVSLPPEAVAEPEDVGAAPADPEPDAAPPPEPAPVSPTPVTGTPALATNDPAHANASRVARVMVADLYLYNKEAVEEGIRNDDFFDRNKEALADMRTTYESRVPEDVRAKFDFLEAAIRDFIDKKRGKLSSS